MSSWLIGRMFDCEHCLVCRRTVSSCVCIIASLSLGWLKPKSAQAGPARTLESDPPTTYLSLSLFELSAEVWISQDCRASRLDTLYHSLVLFTTTDTIPKPLSLIQSDLTVCVQTASPDRSALSTWLSQKRIDNRFVSRVPWPTR